MKSFIVFLSLFAFSNVVFAQWKSVTTDVEKDCVVISSSTEEAPIDFFKSECKSFAGFSLYITGGDLRYGPELEFAGKKIDLQSPYHFHDLASNEIKWFYQYHIDKEGTGEIEWSGMIYKLHVAQDDVQSGDVDFFFTVKLNGKNSCVVGMSKTESEAQTIIYSSKSKCININE